MPRPLTDRQAWARERHDELPARLAAFRADLEVAAPSDKARREMRAWQIRRVQLRMAELDRRLGRSVD